MKRWRMLWAVTGLLIVIVAGNYVKAAEFSPALDNELSQKGSSDLVRAIIIFPSPIDIQVLDEQLHERKASRLERKVQVLQALHYNAEQVQPKFRAEFDDAIARGEVIGYTAYWIENLFVVQATKSFIEGLRPRGDISFCSENFKAELIDPIRGPVKDDASPSPITSLTVPPGIQAIHAYQVNNQLGLTGQGVLVGICDTGVSGTHPALATRWRGNFAPVAECWRDDLGGQPTPMDTYGHGTHVMGTIAGRAIVGSDTQWVGCAPDARWIATNAINQGTGPAFDNDVIGDYQWFADPDGNPNTLGDDPDVVQNSWGVNGSFSGYLTCDSRWNTVVLNCEATGTTITWSAGNEGPGASTLRTPANYSINATQIFSVGAVDASAYPTTPYPIASFSSRGPTPCTPASPDNIKPEVVAPGVNVYSSLAGSLGGNVDTYGLLSGTSMAGPHVAGCVALMRQACPNCDPTTIKMALMNTAIDAGYPPTGDDNTFGHGFIDCYQAVLAVSNLGHLVGIVTDAGNNPVAGATVHNANGLQSTQTLADGTYDLGLSSGTYNIAYSKFGYVPQQINGLVITQGQNTTQNVILQLSPTGTVSGTVTSCGGGPAVGASVTILNTPIPAATTNASGFYSISNVPQGTYDMTASGGGCGPQTVTGVVIGANTTQNFTLTTDPHFLCSAPDGAGYIACEDGDLGGPTFSWLEISPGAGGPGTLTGINLDDQALSIALPFTFRHYGVNYTSVFVSSNGLLTFSSANAGYTEGTMASVGQPAIAPFWDDLFIPGGGDLSMYRYTQGGTDAEIFEWRAVPHYSSGGPYTFQIWLYNVATNPQPNGNSQIRIQYLNMNGVNSSTVGTTGGTAPNTNQYVFDNSYDPNAQGLVNNRAITYGTATAPAAPTGLTIAVLSVTNQLQFNWTASPGATGYTLYSSTVPGGPFSTIAGTSATNSLTISNPGNSLLFYVVTAHN